MLHLRQLRLSPYLADLWSTSCVLDRAVSILLYGNEVWADALKLDYRLRILSSVLRIAALRVASAYRTISKSATLVKSGKIPLSLQASERKRVWETKNVNEEAGNVDDARK